jgi:hypothetical protein
MSGVCAVLERQSQGQVHIQAEEVPGRETWRHSTGGWHSLHTVLLRLTAMLAGEVLSGRGAGQTQCEGTV